MPVLGADEGDQFLFELEKHTGNYLSYETVNGLLLTDCVHSPHI